MRRSIFFRSCDACKSRGHTVAPSSAETRVRAAAFSSRRFFSWMGSWTRYASRHVTHAQRVFPRSGLQGDVADAGPVVLCRGRKLHLLPYHLLRFLLGRDFRLPRPLGLRRIDKNESLDLRSEATYDAPCVSAGRLAEGRGRRPSAAPPPLPPPEPAATTAKLNRAREKKQEERQPSHTGALGPLASCSRGPPPRRCGLIHVTDAKETKGSRPQPFRKRPIQPLWLTDRRSGPGSIELWGLGLTTRRRPTAKVSW